MIYTRYPVPNHNKRPTNNYFNSCKSYLKTKHEILFGLFCELYGSEKAVFEALKKDMTEYTFGCEQNVIEAFYIHHKEKIDEIKNKQKSSGKVFPPIQQTQKVSQQDREDAQQAD